MGFHGTVDDFVSGWHLAMSRAAARRVTAGKKKDARVMAASLS
jgi:hypothetical protein